MDYQEAVEWLYSQTPQFQQIGAAAYKPGLDTVRTLAGAFGNPQNSYRIVHVAGTNGKGSTCHTLAAILHAAGLKVGLYTSPHLVDFRERIRVDGEMIPREEVASFVGQYLNLNLAVSVEPSFFELTTVMAFEWFARCGVDVAVVEVGLGGRLDSTNIVNAEIGVITNVSFDHCAQLGHTLRQIAHEKSGIMRPGVPLICGETDAEVQGYFEAEALEHGADLIMAQNDNPGVGFVDSENGLAPMRITGTPFGNLDFQLTGICQHQNALTILSTVKQLNVMGWAIPDEAVKAGMANVADATGLNGRWMVLGQLPLTVCDTGHNEGGWRLLSEQLAALPRPLTVVLGFVNDKDIDTILHLLPADARYVFTNASIPRALPAAALAAKAKDAGLDGLIVSGVREAYETALAHTPSSGSVFVGGSTFVVADLLKVL